MRSYIDIIDPYLLTWFQFCVWRTTSWTCPVREVCLAAPSAWASQWRWQRSWCFSSCTKQPKVLRKSRQHGGSCIFAIHQLPNISPTKKNRRDKKLKFCELSQILWSYCSRCRNWKVFLTARWTGDPSLCLPLSRSWMAWGAPRCWSLATQRRLDVEPSPGATAFWWRRSPHG